MKQEYRHAAQVEALGRVLHDIAVANAQPWDECLYRQETLMPDQTGITCTYRHGRRLDYVAHADAKRERLLEFGMDAIFRQIATTTGTAPKVGVLSVTADGHSRFFYDTQGGGMHISFHTVGLRSGYFSRAQIDPPAFVLEELENRAKWEALLEHGASFELSFLESDFGLPCPDNLRAVEDALHAALTESDFGKVTAIEYEDLDGRHYERLRIGVIDAEEGARRIIALLHKLCAPASTTLKLVAPREFVYDPGLKSRDELVTEHTTRTVQELVRETIHCSPSSWRRAVLTIGTDGSWLDYQLKNAGSPGRAVISSTLKKLCEDLCVIMWLKGDCWTRATLTLTEMGPSTAFKIDFGYETPAAAHEPAPRQEPIPAVASRPWWRKW